MEGEDEISGESLGRERERRTELLKLRERRTETFELEQRASGKRSRTTR